MQARFTLAVLLGVVLIAAAACSGGGDDERIAELETDLAASEEALERETEARETADDDAAAAKKKADDDAAAAKKKADDDAAAAKKKADDDAAAAKKKADDDAAEAERLRLEAEAARQTAEAERARLAAAAEERRKADAAERARTAISGDRTIGATATLAVGAIEYGEPAPVTTPVGPFTTSTGRSGVWSTTSLTAIAEPTRDMIQIYSDVEAPASVPFKDSSYNQGGNPVVDNEGNIVYANGIDMAGDREDVASSSFPRSSGPAKSFDYVYRGFASQTEKEQAITDCNAEAACIARNTNIRVRNTERYPEPYSVDVSGMLSGARGTFRCAAGDTITACKVENRGGSFFFAGPWKYRPSSGTTTVSVPDAEYMWFGVWARQTVRLSSPPNQPTELWRFEANHGGNEATSFDAATGSATYQGPAAGRYAVYEPDTGDSGIGSFTASATLHADFDSATNTVAGSITNFSNDPGWSLALKRKDIASGAVAAATDDVTWTIDGVPDDSGSWEAQFYNNLPTNNGTITYQPHGIAGTFQATYDPSGVDPSGVGARAAVIGAFGAHR